MKVLEKQGNLFMPTGIVSLNYIETHHFYKSRFYVAKKCKKNWEQLRCVAHSPMNVGMPKAILILLGVCIVRTQGVRVYFPCTRDFSLSAEAIIIVLNASLPVKSLILPVKNVLPEEWPGDLHFWRDSKISSRRYWRCVLSQISERKVYSPFKQQMFYFLRL